MAFIVEYIHMENGNQPIENSLIKGFGIKGIALLVLTIFALLIAYKYISSNIQENKEKAVIETPIKAVLPEITRTKTDKYQCGLQNEVDYDKDWLHACYLRGLLTEECKQLFDINGYYLTDNYDPAWAPNGYVDLYTYYENALLCMCKLPSDIANQINRFKENGEERCAAIGVPK